MATTGLGPDGEKVVDMTYYDLLGVATDATELEIKKGYRRAAIKYHPDKNVGDPTAEAKFQAISEAYGVLSDSNLRAVYNKSGKDKAVNTAGEEFMADPGALFGSMFGGKAFLDWIGEISLGKDVSKAFEMSTTEEERDQMKADLDAPTTTSPALATPPVTATASSTLSHSTFTAPSDPISLSSPASPRASASKSSATTSTTFAPATSPPPAVHPTTASAAPTSATPAPRPTGKTPEQRAAAEAYDRERVLEKRERIRVLAEKLRARLRPCVESTRPGEEGDQETLRWAARMKEEVGDLALESFGIELCHLIGSIYSTKATSFIRLNRKPTSNILGVPGFFSRLKEKTTMLKEGWSFLSVGLDIQSSMAAMKLLEEGGEEKPGEEGKREEELKRIEGELSGKLLLVAWKGSKFELSAVLRSVVDEVLTKESSSVTDTVLMHRAKALLLCGAILKSVTPDETDTERRELERIVEAANQKRKDKKSGKKTSAVTTPPVVKS